MSEPYVYVYKPYPRRLYMGGQVIPGDLHARNSVVVQNEAEEAAARLKGYRKPHEPEPTGGHGDSSPPGFDSFRQEPSGDERPAAADPLYDIAALRARAAALGLKVDGRWKEARLRDEIAKHKESA